MSPERIMPIKTIMSVCSPDQSDDDLKAAAELCAAADAHLALVVVGIAVPPPVGEYAVELSFEWQELRRKDLDGIASKANHASQILERYGISFDIETEYAEPAWLDDAVGLRARYCDLVYLNRNILSADDIVVPLMQGCLFQSARPVLIGPAGMTPTLKPKNVLIAWDSRTESARAVASGLEIIAAANEVRVAIVDPVASDARNGGEPGADVATYLARHGLKVVVDQLASGGRPTDEVLKQHATDVGADTVVMGAYSHSRLRERIFGGVTRSFIEGANLPVLMAH
jgi:nucleotide-binding universal stress UspA family protein